MPTNYILTVNFTEQGINTLKQANEQAVIVRLSVYLSTLLVVLGSGSLVKLFLRTTRLAALMFIINPLVPVLVSAAAARERLIH